MTRRSMLLVALLSSSLGTGCSDGPGTHTISGTISGAVVAGVPVNLTGALTTTTRTDGTGGYSFNGLANGAYTVMPSLAGYAFAPASLGVTLAGADAGGLNFTASPSHSISGKVSGDVVAGVTVSLSGASTAATTTDGTGAYSFTGLANGAYTVTPSLAGYVFAPASRAVTLAGADINGLNFTASRLHSISGTVVGDAVAGVTVSLSGASTATTTTDGTGAYSFTGLANGAYTVTPSLAGYGFDPVRLWVTLAGVDLGSVDFTSSRLHSISGTVSGDVTAGVTVSLSGASTATTTTDGTGAYSFTDLWDGAYTITPSLAGCRFDPAKRAVALAGADVGGVNFTATRSHSISGKVAGDVIAGVTVSLSGTTTKTTTDGTGAYSFTGLWNGTYTVTPSLAGYRFDPASQAVTLAGADVGGVNFTASRPHSISGTVSGDVVAFVTVSLSGASTATTTTNGAGAYSFTGLWNGAYTVAPSLAGYRFDPASRAVTLAGADLAGVDFTASHPHSISGTVSGDVTVGVTVSLSGTSSATTTTDRTGAYSFTGLWDGAYTVTPSLAGCTFEPASVLVTVAGADVASQNFTGTASEPPPAPTNVSAFPGNGTATVSWEGNGASFKVYYALTPDVMTSDASVTSTTSPATVESIANGTPYYFAVAGINSKGEGPVSTVACAVPTPANTAGLTLHDPLCGSVFDARKWQPPGPYSFRVDDGVALLSVDADRQEPRHLRDANVESSVSVNAGSQRVTTLTADVMVPAASVLRTGGAHVRAAVRLQYEPPAFRLNFPGRLRDALVLEVGLIEAGGGLQAFRGIAHCDAPSCGPVSTTGIAFDDPTEFVAIGAGTFHGAPAAYDTTYTVTASLDEATGLFHWTVAGGSFGAGISGSADPSVYLASTTGWSGVPLAGAGFWTASILARSQDESEEGGGRGKITAQLYNVRVGLDGEAASPFDDFSGTGVNSRSPEFSLAKWNASGAVEMAPSGGSLRMHQQATSAGAITSFGHGIRIADPSGTDIIQADVTIDSFGSTGPGSASEDAVVQGRFYNDGSGVSPFSAVGDVLAGVALRPATNTAMWWVGRCTTDTCSGALESLGSGSFSGVTVGQGLHTVKVVWDPYFWQFTLAVDGNEVVWVMPNYAGPANAPFKEVSTNVSLPADEGTGGFITARVNNVFTGVVYYEGCSTSGGSGTIAFALAAAALARRRRRPRPDCRCAANAASH